MNTNTANLTSNSNPPLPPYAMDKPHQFKVFRGMWIPKQRFRTKKHRGACAGAFGGTKK